MSATEMTTIPQANKKIVARWFDEVWNLGRRETIHELFGASCVLHDGKATYRGPDEFCNFYDLLQREFSKFSIKPIIDLAEGDLVCTHFLVECTHTSSARPVKFTATVLIRLENGQFAEAWQNWDAAAVMQQVPGFSIG
jgi:predicted SnoaL-like aldol condensation-catalyzing enzyme